MAKLFRCLGLIVTLGCSCAGPAYVPEYPDADGLFDSVVALVQEDGRAFCSGVQIEQGVLTAAHCVHEGESTARVGERGSYDAGRFTQSRVVRVLRINALTDLALLDYHGPRPLRVRGHQPRVGESVIAMGHPLGHGYVAQYGHVSSAPKGTWYFLDPGIAPGMSGGPVIDRRGEVVGICQTMRSYMFWVFPNLGGAASVPTIRAFLD